MGSEMCIRDRQTADMLKDDEIVVPILTQFATIAAMFDGHIGGIKSQFSVIYKDVTALTDVRDRVKGEILDIIHLFK